MSTYSIIIPASKPTYLADCVHGVTKVFPDYQEILVGMSPQMPTACWEFVEQIPRVKILPGTNKTTFCGEVIFNLMDQCLGDWIVNADDDDVWAACDQAWVDSLPNEVGFISGSSLYCTYRVRNIKTSFRKLTPQSLSSIDEIVKSGLPGSFRLTRRDAYQRISSRIDRSFYWNDYRLVCELLKAGYKIIGCPEVWGLVRRFNYRYDDTTIPTWESFLAEVHNV